jgi:hypothetical protein
MTNYSPLQSLPHISSAAHGEAAMHYRGRQYSVEYEVQGRHGIHVEAIWNDESEDVKHRFEERTIKAIASEIWENDSYAQESAADDFTEEYHERTGNILHLDMMDLRQMMK